jgi:hypothetical protein
MCFSATASFVTAAVTGAAGIAALSRADRRESLLLAAVPLFFATQQAIEGMLWLLLPGQPEAPSVAALTTSFLLFAKVFWPVVVPAAVYLVETDQRRRRMLAIVLAAGAVVASYFAWSILNHRVSAQIGHGHIVYTGEPLPPLAMAVAYFAVTGLTATLSSFWTLRAFAHVVLAGSLVSYVFYWEAFSSVWCFFAAVASVIIVVHFEQARHLPRAVSDP